jgi:flagellar biosynthesis/type III secretory pathway ATPase
MLNGGHGRLYARAESVQDLEGDVLNISGKDEKLQPYAQLNRGTNGGGSVNFRNGTRLSAGEQRVGRVIDNTVANPRGVLKQASESEIAKTALYALQ